MATGTCGERTPTTSIRIFVADSHPLCIAGIETALASATDIELVGSKGGWDDALPAIAAMTPDVAVIDDALAGCERPLSELRERGLDVRVLFLFDSVESASPFAAMAAGASGCLTRHVGRDAIAEAVREVAAGRQVLPPALERRLGEEAAQRLTGPALTGRQREVLRLVAGGRSGREVAGELGVSYATVKAELAAIYGRLDVADRAAAVAAAMRHGLLA